MKLSDTRSFSGFPADTTAFYRELSADNRREWWEANRARYRASVLAPAQAFVAAFGSRLAELEPRMHFDAERLNGSGSIFRPQRDIRFSADKSPYKRNLGMLFWLDDGRSKKLCPHLYVGIYSDKAIFHAGLESMPQPLLGRYRTAVAETVAGKRLQSLLQRLARHGFDVGEPTRRRVPSPWEADHRYADLLRRDGVHASTAKLGEGVVTSPRLIEECTRLARQTLPLLRWLSEALGPQ